jgi:hypothetical protein
VNEGKSYFHGFLLNLKTAVAIAGVLLPRLLQADESFSIRPVMEYAF